MLPPSYTILRKDRSSGDGGVFIGVGKSLTVSEEPKFIMDCKVVIWAKLHFQKQRCIFVHFIDHPTVICMYPIIQLNESLTKLPNREPMILVGGNFNLLDIAWLDGYDTTRPNPAYGLEINNLFLNIIGDKKLE